MSILLNALNKSNNEQESAEALDELIEEPVKTGNESEQTADSDVAETDVTDSDVTDSDVREASSFNMMAVMFGFLSLIVILLLVIVFLLLQQGDDPTAEITKQLSQEQQLSQKEQLSQDRLQTQSSPLNSSAEKVIADNQSSVNKSSGNKPEVSLTENSVSEKLNRTQPEHSASSKNEELLATSNDQYFESFKPEKQAVERITKTETNNDNSQADMSGSKQHHNEQLANQSSNVANSSATESSGKSSTSSSSQNPQINKALPIKEFDQLTEIEQLMVNEITLDAHVYSEEASQRFIFMNDALIQEGEKIINSWYLESIEPDGIVVNNGVLRVNIEKQ